MKDVKKIALIGVVFGLMGLTLPICDYVYIHPDENNYTTNYSCCNDTLTSEGNVYEGFESRLEWAYIASNTTIWNETVNVIEGIQAINMTVAGNQTYSGVQKTTSLNFNDSDGFVLWVYISNATKLAASQKVVLYLSSTPTWSKYFLAPMNVVNGWNRVILHKSDFTNVAGESWSNTMIRYRIRYNFLSTSTSNGFYSVLDKHSFGYTARSKAVITFDDADKSVYTHAYPIMKTYNQNGVVFTPTALVGAGSVMDVTNLTNLYLDGWDISSHTVNHTDLTTVSNYQLEMELVDSKAWLDGNGFTRSSWYIAYPYGSYTDNVVSFVENAGYVMGRRTGYTIQSPMIPESWYQYRLTAYTVLNTTNHESVKDYIDYAIANNSNIYLLFHRIVDTSADTNEKYLTSDFQEIMDYLYVKSNYIDTVTLSDLMEPYTIVYHPELSGVGNAPLCVDMYGNAYRGNGTC
jgi:peptidoglycan/xylan/chitin deacetylase (PgdA/CDA1 family)